MNTGGEAGEQMVRMSLNGVEVAAKITGAGAKQLAVLLYTIAKEQDKTKGAARLSSMLRSGKELKVFTVRQSDLKTFAKEAKRYGVLYCALKGIRKNPDGMVDVMVRAEDASKINRIVERFELAAVDKASIRNEITKDREEKASQTEKAEASRQQGEQVAPGLTEEESQQAENFLNELMGTEKAEVSREPGERESEDEKSGLKKADRKKQESDKPEQEKTDQGKAKQKAPIVEKKAEHGENVPGERQGQTNARLSEPISTKQKSSGRTSSDDGKGGRRSVREELEEIRQSREQAGKAKAEPEKTRQQEQKRKPGQKKVMHQQPEPGKRRRKGKER